MKLFDKVNKNFHADIEFKQVNQGKYTLEELGSLMKISLPSAIADVMIQYKVIYNQDQH